ncbi:cytochrome P450 [Thamnocephalis sphaerospora]|uniref:Cytochrome P450 n=1 Tax=Thamnocephalis sphaerospora TaxID=78915 RepID=A0A4P9XSJ8_9FUNG|nr:cytochrome P450 [Thamnocephalis sphaerospora]|eukprot:RKP09113.1 cytochrome P450 [Thamnocephalis sphaerospora]
MLLKLLLSWEIVPILLVAYTIYRIIINTVVSPLRKIPGPWYCMLSETIYTTQVARGTQLQWMQQLHEKYGPMVRVAPGIVSVRDVDAAHAILSSQKFVKGPVYEIFNVTGHPNIFSARNPATAKARRKLALPMFTRSALKEMDDMIMSAGVRPLLKRLERHAEAGDTINIMQLFFFMTFNVMGDIALNRNFNMMEDDDIGNRIVAQINDTIQLCIYTYAFGPLANKWMFPRLHESKRQGIEFFLKAIRARRAIENPRPDSLNRYLTAIKEEKLDNLTEMDMAGDILVQFIGGTDTTAISCAWTIYLLSGTPDVYSRLLQEIREAVPDINTEIRHAMVCDLPYLNAVINEALRIYPVGGGDIHRVVPKGGAELCGKYLPENTIVMAPQYALNHWDKIWDEPNAFRPERWLTTDSARLDEMKRAFFPFSTGTRACVGRELAWMELRVTLASLIRRFEVEVVRGNDMTPVFSLVVGPRGHALQCRLTKRTEEPMQPAVVAS